MKWRRSPLAFVVGGAVAVAVLSTVAVDGGWMIWIPTLLALLVVGSLKS